MALVLEPGADPLLCSHGRERGPLAIRFSDECRYQPRVVTRLAARLDSGAGHLLVPGPIA